jgi:hypothetical protein
MKLPLVAVAMMMVVVVVVAGGLSGLNQRGHRESLSRRRLRYPRTRKRKRMERAKESILRLDFQATARLPVQAKAEADSPLRAAG